MFEHVGRAQFDTFFGACAQMLADDGVMLLHTIGRNIAKPVDRWTEKRIFPGSCPPSLRQMTDIFEAGEF